MNEQVGDVGSGEPLVNYVLLIFQTITMKELRAVHDECKVEKTEIELIKSQHGGWLDEDPRLSLYGFSVEIINLLILPMIKEK